jgi:hypothetical protein
MKKTIAIALTIFLISSIDVFAQTLKEASEDSLYFKALSVYLNEAAKKYANIKTARDYNKIIIQKDENLTANLPNNIGSQKIQIKDLSDIRDEFRRGKVKVPVTVVRPMENEGEKLIIRFTEYWVNFTDKKTEFSLEGGCKVEFLFDCTKRKYVINKVEFWGV